MTFERIKRLIVRVCVVGTLSFSPEAAVLRSRWALPEGAMSRRCTSGWESTSNIDKKSAVTQVDCLSIGEGSIGDGNFPGEVSMNGPKSGLSQRVRLRESCAW